MITQLESGRLATAPDARRVLPWLLLLFFGSGCAALIYEIVWFQLLQLVIGLTNISLGLLLGTFMGGMCLGSLLLPRLIPARFHPLRVYALLELGIGIIGILILFIVPWASRLYASNAGGGLPGILLRGLVAVLCLIPPTVLMGATLPAVARWIESNREGVSWLGFFYGGNIAGAVVGCLLAGFYLLRVHDMATATYFAASINAAVALLSFVLASRMKRAPDAAPDTDQEPRLPASAQHEVTGPAEPADRLIRPVYLAIALSGMSALGAEVVWTRLLSLIMGGTVYTFSLILAVFLVGLGIGSTLGAFVARWSVSRIFLLGCCQLFLIPAIGWAAMMITGSLPYWPINPSISLSPWFNLQLDLARCLWTILPAAIVWGASFPIALAAVATRGQDFGRLVGGIYAANTVGAILGALAFSLVVIPLFGTQWAQRLLIALSAMASLVVFVPTLGRKRSETSALVRNEELPSVQARTDIPQQEILGLNPLLESPSREINRSPSGIGLLLAPLGLAGIIMWAVSPAPWGIVAYGRFMATYGNRLAPGIVQEEDVPSRSGPPDIYCTYMGEGLNGTIAVTKWTSGVRNFHSAGKVQASNEPRDMRLQRMLGHISALIHRKPESVLVVACGAGVTAGTFVLHPEVKRLVICDIEPLVPKVVAPMFDKENYGVVRDPRTQVISDDGRHFIRTTKEKFDIITSDPIDPWVKGCAALNTVEYYQMCKEHLNPGGVMSLWIPLYESNSETVKSLIATFFKVFPDGVLWSNDSEGEGYDAVLLGQAEPTLIDVDELQERIERPDHARVKASLAEVGFRSGVSLLATYAGQARDLQEWMRDGQINTDSNLRLQYLAGMSFNSYVGPEILNEMIRYRKFPENLFRCSDQRKLMLNLHFESDAAKQSEKGSSRSGNSTNSHAAAAAGELAN